MNRIKERLTKMAAANENALDECVDNLMVELLKERCNNIGYEYDDSIMDQVAYDPKWDELNKTLNSVYSKLVEIADQWEKDTKNNYM